MAKASGGTRNSRSSALGGLNSVRLNTNKIIEKGQSSFLNDDVLAFKDTDSSIVLTNNNDEFVTMKIGTTDKDGYTIVRFNNEREFQRLGEQSESIKAGLAYLRQQEGIKKIIIQERTRNPVESGRSIGPFLKEWGFKEEFIPQNYGNSWYNYRLG